MKQNFYLIFALTMSVVNLNCTTGRVISNSTGYNLIEIAIRDFSLNEKKLLAESNTFYVRSIEIDQSITGISISPHKSTMHFDKDSMDVSDVKGPTKVLDVDGVLFYWDDPKSFMSKATLSILKKYDMVFDDLDKYRDSLDKNDFASSKATDYYFCESSPARFKKKKSNVAMGHYDPPKLKCK